MSTSDFRSAWHRVVAEWVSLADRDRSEARAVLTRALEGGVSGATRSGFAEPELRPEDSLRCEMELIRLSGAVDCAGYRQANPGIARREEDPVEHFCTSGWRNLHNPSLEFDVWWYWFTHLGLDHDDLNPLLHYLLEGRHSGAACTQPQGERTDPVTYEDGHEVRRACLFAAHDADGMIADCFVAYVQELSRHADVYYLASTLIDEPELRKLDGVARGAWSVPHDAGHFGSYARLAQDLVGWDVLEQYDEVLLANDDAYLLRPLDDVLGQMNAQPCDWWALNATKRGSGSAADTDPQWRQSQHLQLSSQLLVLRRPALLDPGLRRLLASVKPQSSKGREIGKYEIGMSRLLAGAGHYFETVVPGVSGQDVAESAEYFDLLDDGFPLLRRSLLVQNPAEVPDLVFWKERIGSHVPDAPVEQIEQHMRRVAADDQLQRSFSIVTGADGTIENPRPFPKARMSRLDEQTPKYDHWWAFPVCAYDHTFASNERAVFEEVRNDPSIKKIVLTRSRRIDVDGENVVVVPLMSREGQYYVLRSRQIFVKHAPIINIPFPISVTEHNFINLWHGIPLKRFGYSSHDTVNVRDRMAMHHLGARAVITSSKIDTLAMTAAFYPLTIQDMWPTGLPRNDFIVRDEEQMPPDLRAQEMRLRDEVAGRRLLMFLPTFKQGQAASYYEFSESELDWLRQWCERNHAVIGVREHMADRAHTYSRMLAPLNPVNLSSRRYPDLEVLYRVASGLVTDYSSCLIDFMLTGQPVISFAYDYERYANDERGLFYDLEQVVPGPVCRSFDEFAESLDVIFEERSPAALEDYAWRRRTFFDHLDDQSARRVVERVKGLYVRGA